MTDDLFIKRSADFSPDRKYRYTLIREWDASKPRCLFILLNPSTADAEKDDPTNRRGINFAIQWGFGACVFCNLFAFRTPDPKVMKAEDEPVGPENDEWLLKESKKARITIAAWGIHGTHRDRNERVLELLAGRAVHCMGLTNDGHPKHILYLLSGLRPEIWKKYGEKT